MPEVEVELSLEQALEKCHGWIQRGSVPESQILEDFLRSTFSDTPFRFSDLLQLSAEQLKVVSFILSRINELDPEQVKRVVD